MSEPPAEKATKTNITHSSETAPDLKSALPTQTILRSETLGLKSSHSSDSSVDITPTFIALLLIQKMKEGKNETDPNKPQIIQNKEGFNKTDEGKKFIEKMKEMYKKFNTYHSDHCIWVQYETLIKYGYLEKPNLFKRGYMGHCACRVCSLKNNGSEDFVIQWENVENSNPILDQSLPQKAGLKKPTFTEWIIPEGYLHYLENHGVKPSSAFQKFINSLDIEKLTSVRALSNFEIQLITALSIETIREGMWGLVFSE